MQLNFFPVKFAKSKTVKIINQIKLKSNLEEIEKKFFK